MQTSVKRPTAQSSHGAADIHCYFAHKFDFLFSVEIPHSR